MYQKEGGFALIVDTREPKKMAIAFERLGCKVEREALTVGDYYDCNVTVERKQIGDLVNKIFSGALFKQVRNLANKARCPILIIVGSIEDFEESVKHKKLVVNRNAIYGAIASLVVRYGIHVLWVRDDREFCYIVKKIFDKAREGKLGKPHSIRRLYKGRDRKIIFLQDMLYISEKQAKSLLERFGSPMNIIMANSKDLESVKGIGPSTAQKIQILMRKLQK